MKQFSLFFSFAFLCLVGFSQDLSNKGREFWLGYGNHVRMFDPKLPISSSACYTNANNQLVCPETMELYVTSDVNTKGYVEIKSIGFIDSFNVYANQITKIDIPRTAALYDEGKFGHGIHVVAEKTIVVYGFIYVSAVSGATVCLPTSVLGKEYYSVNYTQISNEPDSYSYFFVVATEDNTKVRITPSAPTKSGRLPNVPFEIILNKGEVYQVLGKVEETVFREGNQNVTRYLGQDLTGSKIESIASGTSQCKKIAVFSGSGKISIGCNSPQYGYHKAGSSDNLFQQIYPTSAWGKKYITAPTINSNAISPVLNVNYFRIFKKDSTSKVKVDGLEIDNKLFNKNYYDFSSSSPNIIESLGGSIMVAQYLTTSGVVGLNNSHLSNCNNSGLGDPDMIFLNPVEQVISDVTMNSMQPEKNTNLNRHFVNVIIKNEGTAIETFKIDNVSYSSNFIAHPLDKKYSYATIYLGSPGGHRIQSDSGFNAIAYGVGSAESYAYSAGTNLKDLNQYVSIKNKYATVNFPSTCKDAPFNLSITLPFKPLSLGWKFYGNPDLGTDPDVLKGDPGLPIVPDDSILSTTNAKSFLYIYKLKNLDKTDREFKISKKGIVPVDVIANNPTADGCSGEQTIPYDITVYDPPTNTINSSNIGCLEDTVVFTANTQTEDVPILKYLWTIDDILHDTLSKNYAVKYNSEGLKKVSLSIITNIGCLSKNFDTTILLSSKPTPQFQPAGSLCIGKEQTLIDKSSPKGNSTIEEWIWSYSDKQKSDTFIVSSPSKSPLKTFNDSIVIVKLDLKTNSGCKNSLSDTLKIRPNPIVKMILPEICLEDSIAVFKSVSTVSGIENRIDLYEWNFGDSASNKESNKGVGEISKHRYIYPGNYTISLSTTTNFGCNSIADSSFTINGSTPRAEFKVISESGLCSNKPITIKNTSEVDVGSVGKIELFWDFDGLSNKPDSTDENPKVNGLYSKKFEDFQFTSRQIRIYMTAYTGGVCKDSYDSTIILNGSPLDSLRDLSPICTRKDKRLLDAAVIQKVSGVNGVEVYSGKGVVSEGGKYYFDPKIDSGYYTIYHKYTTEKGCYADDSTVIRVNFTPVIDAGPDMTVLDDTSRQVLAKATGVDIKYNWTPKLYLSSDTVLQPLVIKPVTDITYKLTVTGAGNCIETDQFRMTALNMIEPTNTFTPNGDGINDTWSIKYIEKYPESVVEVFNIQGNRVYKSPSKYLPWDGKTKEGNVLPAGTYYYFIDPRNFRKQRTGFVTILK